VDAVVTTAAHSPRAIDPETLAARVREATQATVYSAPDVASAVARAVSLAGPRDLVCATGSLYLVAEALLWFAVQPGTSPGAIEIAGRDHD
jgi:dihydrofolate synthase/folylpolyglutamate synthase